MIGKFTVIVIIAIAGCSISLAGQNRSTGNDTMQGGHVNGNMIYVQYPDSQHTSMGLSILASLGGFGLGGYYRHEYSDVLSSFIDFSVSEAVDDDERDYIDEYGNTETYNQVNRFLILPLFVGVEKRLFKDDILDNFRPYISGAVGPSMIYVFPSGDEFFSAIGKGQPKYTFGGYFGFGAYFGSERSSTFGMNLRYYIVPYPAGIESLQGTTKTQFGGFYISINFGGVI